MIVLDTNVLSALMRATPDPVVVAWLDSQPADSIWITAVTVFEIHFGLNVLPQGKKRKALQAAFEMAIEEDLEGRVLDFDPAAAEEAAVIAARLRAAGRPIEIRDVQIAATVAARRGTLATGNTKHFEDAGVALVDPWEGKGRR